MKKIEPAKKVEQVQKLAPERRPSAGPVPPAAPGMLVNDDAATEDLLDAQRYAHLFARLVAARALQPPLAIGLFGSWGAGKSHFMHLMHQHIEALGAGPVQGVPVGESWPRVCQIRFNAWHYMDADLWASLAAHIFEELAKALGTKGDEQKVDEARAELQRRLCSTEQARREAVAARAASVAALAAAQQKLSEAERKQATLLRVVAPKVFDELAGRLGARGRSGLDEALAAIGVDAGRDEVKAALTAPEQVEALAADLRSTGGQARALAVDARRHPGWWLVGLLVVVVVPPLGKWLADRHGLAPFGDAPTALLVQLGSLVAVGLMRGRAVLERVQHFMRFAEQVRSSGAELRDQIVRDLTGDERKAADEAHKDLAAARTEQRAIEAQLLAIEAELDGLRAGRRVYDLVLSRAAPDGRYRSREGIVSIVRRDLESLAHLISLWSGERAEGDGSRGHDTAEGEGGPPVGDDARALPQPIALDDLDQQAMQVQRIVLYIDDLDRCPPERVVEVLQAVQLLLAFDLFVVVVAVDPRWLERSLERSYHRLLLPPVAAGGPRVSATGAATARDYLEKIFQVPFTLPRVGKEGYDKLLGMYLPNADEVRAAEQAASTESPEMDVRHAAEPAGRSAFHLEPPERHFASRFGALFDTPRSVKRFANIYRLLRAGVKREAYAAFVREGRQAGHRVALTLLAINVSAPRLGCALLRALSQPERLPATALPERTTDLLDRLERDGSPLRQALCLDRAQRRELDRVLPVLHELAADLPADLGPLHYWALRVGRYSLYWHAG